jgi:hypothetical protein
VFEDATDAAGGVGNTPGNGRSIAWADYDGDGWLDFYVTNAVNQANKLYRNEGNGTFEDVAGTASVNDTMVDVAGTGYGVAWADYDNDGDLDLFVANFETPNNLFRNKGNGTFDEVALTAGVADPTAAAVYGVAWADSDNDGHIDLYVGSYQDSRNKLFHNKGDGTFSVPDWTAFKDPHRGSVWGVAWADYDNDGLLDIYVAKEGFPNVLFRNKGFGYFEDVTVAAGHLGDPTGKGRGVAWADYDGDGDLDLYVANNHENQPNKLFRNKGDGTFEDVASTAGVEGGEANSVAWADYDGDGDLDLYVTNWKAPNNLFRNKGDGTFEDVASTANVADDEGLGGGVAWADYDNDGALDFYVVNRYGQASILYRNTNASVAARGLFVRPVDADNRTHTGYTMGAVVSLFEAGTNTRVLGGGARVIDGGGSFGAQNAYDAYFAVADPAAAVDIEVRFPRHARGDGPLVAWVRGVVPADIDTVPFAGKKVVEVRSTIGLGPDCPLAHWCPEGGRTAHPCPVGSYGRVDAQKGQTTFDAACECDLAHWCPGNGTVHPCPIGTHGRADGQVGMTNQTAACPGICTGPGRFVPGTSPACEAFPEGQVEECLAWFSTGSVIQYGYSGCGAGQYQVGGRSRCPGATNSAYQCSKCADCPAGLSKAPGCVRDVGEEACDVLDADCPVAHWCPGDGTVHPCPTGKYGRVDKQVGMPNQTAACPGTCAAATSYRPESAWVAGATHATCLPGGRREECKGDSSSSSAYYGYTGCGAGQYQVGSRSTCPGTEEAGYYMRECSTCADCPAGRYKYPGCSKSGDEACVGDATPPPTPPPPPISMTCKEVRTGSVNAECCVNAEDTIVTFAAT